MLILNLRELRVHRKIIEYRKFIIVCKNLFRNLQYRKYHKYYNTIIFNILFILHRYTYAFAKLLYYYICIYYL